MYFFFFIKSKREVVGANGGQNLQVVQPAREDPLCKGVFATRVVASREDKKGDKGS